jgi:AcrR family transcriptional regulator
MTDAINMPTGCAKRGRPPRGTEDLRRRQLIKAASELFIREGFSACMEDVAKAAGMSKKTIYAFFANKEELFAAVVRTHVEENTVPAPAVDTPDPDHLETALVTYLRDLARAVLVPEPLAFFRLTIAEADRFPELARAFYREGPQRKISIIAGWLAHQRDRGLIDVDPTEAAALLASFVIIEPMRRIALGVSEIPSPADIEARARLAAHVFLRGCLAAGSHR